MVPPGPGDGHPEGCLFCKESPRELKNYKTKHGELKDEGVLEKSLWSKEPLISNDKKVGPLYPLSGGNDQTTGWTAKPGALEEFEVNMSAAPHHIIPGNAAMAPSSLETWTRADKGKIKQDIGYTIDGALNGIFLPHLPEIYWTKRIEHHGRKIPMAEYYGQKWLTLSEGSKQSIGFLIMRETYLQMHYTDHSAPYDAGSPLSYDDETKTACNRLGDLMENFSRACERSKDADDGKHYPPYALVHRINLASERFRSRITGRPDSWKSWVSPLARSLTRAALTGQESLNQKLLISRKYR
ncbi:hypothetical protein MYSTI_06911 [Myxococcus stipitatus DSM 14675]|uniref:Uncharacterized protein n=1 Tax=Myxococcus stipitatus (strain DSM 14675 / JCM 12634 / Mx s8) TaxID=1278073 RepID=L7UNW4_MYXSD|nr:hypothetical protein MYSTI_06911 [Myxococcus stipitatus DSM 14675]